MISKAIRCRAKRSRVGRSGVMPSDLRWALRYLFRSPCWIVTTVVQAVNHTDNILKGGLAPLYKQNL